MNLYQFRVLYVYADGHTSSEPHCIRAETQAAATEELDAVTQVYPALVRCEKVITWLATTPEA